MPKLAAFTRFVAVAASLVALGSACGGNSVSSGIPSGGRDAGGTESAGNPSGGLSSSGSGGATNDGDPKPNYAACKRPTDCALGSVGCCGVCDGANVTAHDFIAYNRAYEKQVKTCGEVACEPCPDSLGEETVKYFLPNCVAGQCVVEDLRTSDLTACELDSDCRARAGNGCCPGCGSKDLLGVRSDQSFEDFVCAEPMPCPQCAPPPWKAVCGALGHCIVPVTAD